MNYEERHSQAQGIYKAGLKKVATTLLPPGQKYAPGTRVRIADDLGPSMSHFISGANATVKYTYAHAYGGSNVKSYCLDIDGRGRVSWYYEYQLTPIDSPPSDILIFPSDPMEKDEREMYMCHCDCLTYRLFSDGSVQCAKCGRWLDEAHVIFTNVPRQRPRSDVTPDASASEVTARRGSLDESVSFF